VLRGPDACGNRPEELPRVLQDVVELRVAHGSAVIRDLRCVKSNLAREVF